MSDNIILPRSYAKTAAAKLAYYQSGKGTPVLLLHGVGLRLESWAWQIEMLQKNYSVFALDMPGHGESDMFKSKSAKLADYVNTVDDFMQQKIGRPTIVIGHSMGALIALSLASSFASCLAVVACNAVYQRTVAAKKAIQERAALLRQTDNIAALAAPTIARWFPPNDKETFALSSQEASAICLNWLQTGDKNGYASAYTVFANEDGVAKESLAALAMPALFMTGDVDKNSTPQMAAAMAEIVPHAKTKIINGGGHLAQLTHYIEVNKYLAAFLAEVDKT
ncbi:MAG: alpha/beta fold hydrolase [Gammaproteobacteria bacterium WSBS_2016_MAG_OTU1]